MEKELHPTLETLVKYTPLLKNLYLVDVGICVSDTEEVIYEIPSKELSFPSQLGTKLKPGDKMLEAIETKKPVIYDVTNPQYNLVLNFITAPIIDKGKAIGSIVIMQSRKNYAKLMEASSQFASASEEISASTDELAQSADRLLDHMHKLTEAQSDMTHQIIETTKILEMINSVAKSTRILGFNAGIEAARAGEAGKGFAVVAKEITKLAEQSAQSVKDISNLLNQLNDKGKYVNSIAKDVSSVADNQAASIGEISKAIQHLVTNATEVEAVAKHI